MKTTVYLILEPRWKRQYSYERDTPQKLESVHIAGVRKSRPENAYAIKVTLDVPSTFFVPPAIDAVIDIPESAIITPTVTVHDNEEPTV